MFSGINKVSRSDCLVLIFFAKYRRGQTATGTGILVSWRLVEISVVKIGEKRFLFCIRENALVRKKISFFLGTLCIHFVRFLCV